MSPLSNKRLTPSPAILDAKTAPLVAEFELFLGIERGALYPVWKVGDEEADRLASDLWERWDDLMDMVNDQQARCGMVAIPVAATVLMALGSRMTNMFRKAAEAAGQIELDEAVGERQLCLLDYMEVIATYVEGERTFMPEP